MQGEVALAKQCSVGNQLIETTDWLTATDAKHAIRFVRPRPNVVVVWIENLVVRVSIPKIPSDTALNMLTQLIRKTRWCEEHIEGGHVSSHGLV